MCNSYDPCGPLRSENSALLLYVVRSGPPSPLRGFGETAFAWLAEPKLALTGLQWCSPPSPLRGFGETAFAGLAEPKLALTGLRWYSPPSPLRGLASAAFAWLAEPKLALTGLQWCSPPPPLRGFGETAFAWLAEPKLTLRHYSRERRLVDHNSASWNRILAWLRRLEATRRAA